jgi:hypothetical protein
MDFKSSTPRLKHFYLFINYPHRFRPNDFVFDLEMPLADLEDHSQQRGVVEGGCGL